LLTVLIANVAVAFHPDIEERIEAIDKLLLKTPDDPDLYYKRGQLHFQHEEFDDALADFEHVMQLDPDNDEVQVARAAALLHGGWPKSAKIILDAFLRDHKENATVMQLRARAFQAMGNHLLAAQDFKHALKHLHNPTPDQYIELADAFVHAGEAYFEYALQSIDEGIERLGPLATLQLFAIDIDKKLDRTDEALQRLDTIAAQSQRKERFLLQRGNILEAAGRFDEARDAYESALDAIAKLPARHRSTTATKAMRTSIQESLDRLSKR